MSALGSAQAGSGERARVRARCRNPAEQLPQEFVRELLELLSTCYESGSTAAPVEG
jgi:hypothetical protein